MHKPHSLNQRKLGEFPLRQVMPLKVLGHSPLLLGLLDAYHGSLTGLHGGHRSEELGYRGDRGSRGLEEGEPGH